MSNISYDQRTVSGGAWLLVVARAVVVLGVFLWLVGSLMPYYRDPDEFQRRYRSLGPGKTVEFHALKSEFESPAKYLEDYGLCLALVGGVTALSGGRRSLVRKISAAAWKVGATGAAAAGVTSLMLAASLFLDARRGEFPWWADSIGIPLAGIPIAGGILLGLAGLSFSLHLWRPHQTQRARWMLRNVGLSVAAATTLVPLGGLIAAGDFFAVTATALWALFYLSLCAEPADKQT